MYCYVNSSAALELKSLKGVPEELEGRIYYQLPRKKIQDSFVQRQDESILIFEGIVANGQEIINRYAARDLPDLIWQVKTRPEILAQLHGQFWLAFHDAESGDFQAFTNTTNNCRLYYYHVGEILIVADRMRTITRILQDNNIATSVDPKGARMILSYGYMLEGYSTISQIRNLPSGSCLSCESGQVRAEPYHEWDCESRHKDPAKCITELSWLFEKAVEQAFARDDEGEHLAFLSGGLDSRAVVYAAHNLGYRGFNVLNFSEPGYLEARVARGIAQELGLGFSFFSLKDGSYLKDIAQNLVYNDGQIVLHGAAHLFEAIKGLEPARYGIIHSGQMGAILKGGYLRAPHHSKADMNDGAYSTRVLQALLVENTDMGDSYPNHELFTLKNRGFNAIPNGDLAAYEYSHSLSPMLSPDFLQYCLNIEPSLRYGGKLYFDWLKQSYPAAAKHKWERTGAPVSDPYLLSKLKYNVWRGSNKIMRKITGKPDRLSMNPFDYWWQTNPQLQATMKREFKCIDEILPRLDDELARDLKIMKNSSIFSERLQAYTLAKGLQYLSGKPDTAVD